MNDLHKDIWSLYRAGLIEARIREDGEWIFSISDKAASMTEDELRNTVESMDDYEIADDDNG
jgi:hypothetical protein